MVVVREVADHGVACGARSMTGDGDDVTGDVGGIGGAGDTKSDGGAAAETNSDGGRVMSSDGGVLLVVLEARKVMLMM